ncbi:MAG: hypothetical protein OEZ36_01905 [Spirochaetota bacterium]|nr:hypothetical protein [Spirochaetota bacterium]
MKHSLTLSFIFLVSISLTANASEEKIRVELANKTISFYKCLSQRQYKQMENMLDEQFEMNGQVHFGNKDETINFFKSTYGKRPKKIDVKKVIVLNYHDLKLLKKSVGIKLSLRLLNKVERNDWVTVIKKLSVNGASIKKSTSLIFRQREQKWLIRGIYLQD